MKTTWYLALMLGGFTTFCVGLYHLAPIRFSDKKQFWALAIPIIFALLLLTCLGYLIIHSGHAYGSKSVLPMIWQGFLSQFGRYLIFLVMLFFAMSTTTVVVKHIYPKETQNYLEHCGPFGAMALAAGSASSAMFAPLVNEIWSSGSKKQKENILIYFMSTALLSFSILTIRMMGITNLGLVVAVCILSVVLALLAVLLVKIYLFITPIILIWAKSISHLFWMWIQMSWIWTQPIIYSVFR